MSRKKPKPESHNWEQLGKQKIATFVRLQEMERLELNELEDFKLTLEEMQAKLAQLITRYGGLTMISTIPWGDVHCRVYLERPVPGSKPTEERE